MVRPEIWARTVRYSGTLRAQMFGMDVVGRRAWESGAARLTPHGVSIDYYPVWNDPLTADAAAT